MAVPNQLISSPQNPLSNVPLSYSEDPVPTSINLYSSVFFNVFLSTLWKKVRESTILLFERSELHNRSGIESGLTESPCFWESNRLDGSTKIRPSRTPHSIKP